MGCLKWGACRLGREELRWVIWKWTSRRTEEKVSLRFRTGSAVVGTVDGIEQGLETSECEGTAAEVMEVRPWTS